jgi:hypothetical protein
MHGMKWVGSAAETVFRRGAGTLAAAMVLVGAAGVNSASADVSYNGFGFIGDQVHITGPNNFSESGGAGQISLNLTTGGTILAWCLDIYDFLQNAGTYSVTPNGAFFNHGAPTPDGAKIGGLMVEGNQLIKNNLPLTLTESGQKYTFSVADISAATQVAIWETEYGAHYTFSVAVSGFDYLVSDLINNAGTSNYFTLDPDPVNCSDSPVRGCITTGNQHLGYAPVPGPILGTGIPGLLAACAGLMALARRRRRSLMG